MTNVVEFKKKAVKADEDDYVPPSDEDVKGFIRILKFIRDLSDSETFELDVTGENLNIKIQNHDLMDKEDDLVQATCFTASAGMPFTPHDEKRLLGNLQDAFESLDFGSVDGDALSDLVDTLRSDTDALKEAVATEKPNGQEDDDFYD